MLLGVGFLASGLIQIALAAAIVRRPADGHLSLSLMINVALIALYVYAVLVGLPLAGGPDSDHSTGLAIGAGEAIDPTGAAAKLAEFTALALAIMLMHRNARSTALTSSPQTPSGAPGQPDAAKSSST